MTGNGVDGDSFLDKERKRKESEQYLMMNFPADVRKNLKGIILPPEKIDRKAENIEKEKTMNNVTENVSNDEGNLSQGQEIIIFHTLKRLRLSKRVAFSVFNLIEHLTVENRTMNIRTQRHII